MSGPRRRGGRRPEKAAADDGNGYMETDPTGRYGRFDELLGKGAMKSVYRGFDELRGVEVAWNQANLADVLRSPDSLQRIYSEVHLLSALRHPSIIAFHASWVTVDSGRGHGGHGRTFNFITELFSSGTLRAFRLRYPRVSLRAVKSWARQILAGLAYLHSRSPPVIHRDLKCDNIFVNGHLGQVKVGDLGLAAVLRGGRAAHSVIGTPEFMAPELYDEEYDERVDVYSFGMCVLEMLTVEYPYAECANPAQIYKKVTAGKLPDAFYRVSDPDARRFVGRCLAAAAARPSAQELLLDPFLAADDHASCPRVMPLPSQACTAESRSDGGGGLDDEDDDEDDDEGGAGAEAEAERPPLAAAAAGRTDMTITGKLNAEDDTMFLKVQIADEGGHMRNIYFPFDLAGDTAAEVATEMVKELDIGDRDPSEIAAMIEQEIARIVPGWDGGSGAGDEQQESYTYGDDDPPYYYLSSSPTSSQGSLCTVGPPTSGGPHGWFQDYCCYPLSSDEDDASCSSAAPPYCSAAGSDGDEAPSHHHHHPHQGSAASSSSAASTSMAATRFRPRGRPEQHAGEGHQPQQRRQQCSMSPHGAGGGRPRHGRGRDGGDDQRRRATMIRNRSMVEMRSQLLHRTLVEELNKRLFFNTVGAVEDIGFRAPSYGGAADVHRRRAGKEKHRYM